VICALLAMTGVFCLTIYIPAMPNTVQAFHTDDLAVKMTVSAYFGTFAFSQLVCGPLSDAFGRRPVIIAFTTVTLIGALMAVFAQSIEFLILSRAVQGIGAGVGNSTTRAVIRDLFVGQAAARVLNLMILMLGLGPTFAPIIGGVMIAVFGWKSVFALAAVYCAMVLTVVVIFLPETNRVRAVNAIHIRQILANYWMALRHPRFTRPGLTVGFTAGVMSLFPTMLPFILIGRFKMDVTEFGLIMGLHAAIYVSSAWVTRLALRHFESSRLVPVGLVLYVGSGLMMIGSLLFLNESIWAIFIPVCGMTFCVPMMQPGLQSEAIAGFGPIAGVVASLIGFLQTLFSFVGTSIASLFGNPVLGLSIVGFTMSLFAATAFVSLRSSIGKEEVRDVTP